MKRNMKGFSLIEMVLVLTIISAIILSSLVYVQQRTLQTQIDKASAQLQQILNAGLSYYVNNGTWPIPPASSGGTTATATGLDCLQGTGTGGQCTVQYLPSNLKNNPWGQPYYVATNSSKTLFYAYTSIPESASQPAFASSTALIIAGTLPLAYTSEDGGAPPSSAEPCGGGGSSNPNPLNRPDTGGGGAGPGGGTLATGCNVVASVNIPGQNLNSARGVNFAGLYAHGACVPVPSCPVDAGGTSMKPQIMVVPVSVTGFNDPNSANAYPLISFSAYATSNNPSNTPTSVVPPPCSANNTTYNPNPPTCTSYDTPAATAYWRVCLQVVTDKGDVHTTNSTPWGNQVKLLAITRCAVGNEAKGTGFNLYSN